MSRQHSALRESQHYSITRKLVPRIQENNSEADLQAGCQALALCHNALDLRQHLLARIQQPLPLVHTQCQVRLVRTNGCFSFWPGASSQ